MPVRTLAIHLPQFHPIRENDEWWGKGFTEWTNVTRPRSSASPGMSSHGCRPTSASTTCACPKTRAAPGRPGARLRHRRVLLLPLLVRGQRLIERPVDEILRSGQPDFPFCLCWANETWSRRWLGEEREILRRQTYSMQDHLDHARWLCAAFADPRYIRVHGRPLFLVYRPLDIPDLPRALATYRETAMREVGSDVYLVGVDGHRPGQDFRELGFDYTLNFRPQLGLVPGVLGDGFSAGRLLRNLRLGTLNGRLKTIDYAEFVRLMEANVPAHDRYFPSVMVGWDNTARRGETGRRRHRRQSRVVPAAGGDGAGDRRAQAGRGAAAVRQRLERMGRRQPPRA